MGLVARQLEAVGIATLCMSSAVDITTAVRPPRAAFLDFPLGHTTGKAHAPELQRAILVAALAAFETLTEPGGLLRLPFRWSEDDTWKERAMAGGDQRTARHDTPQYQEAEDRARAAAPVAPRCGVCGLRH